MANCQDCAKALNPRNQSGRCHPCRMSVLSSTRDRGLDWLPDEWRDDYHKWIRDKRMTASEVKRIILDHVAIRGKA
jgi:hypothetical protein